MKKELKNKFQIYVLLMWRDLKDLWAWCKKNVLPHVQKVFFYIRTSWKSLIVMLPLLVVFYYGVGSLLCEKIDKNLEFVAPKASKNYAFRDAMANLISREIDQHMYTPNLPFFFPAYILDNMPSYQSGIILSLSEILHTITLQAPDENLKKADNLLSYPLNVWLFSKTKDFKLEPSSTAQYRKAKQFLLKTTSHVISNSNICLDAVRQNLSLTEKELDEAINSGSYRKADDVFYKAQGRLYVNYMLLKAIEQDGELVLKNVYEPLGQAILLEPLIVRNGSFASSLSPNHLVQLSYLTLKSENALEKVITSYAHRN